MLFRRRSRKVVKVPKSTKAIDLLFKDKTNPWKDETGRVFTQVGTGAWVDDSGMFNSPVGGSYITTPDAPELRLTGDFILEAEIAGNIGRTSHMSLFQKGTHTNGQSAVGQFFVYQGGIYITSDKGSAYYDVASGLTVSLQNPVKLTIERKGNVLTIKANGTLLHTLDVTGKTFGNNSSPLNINGGNGVYTHGFDGHMRSWSLTVPSKEGPLFGELLTGPESENYRVTDTHNADGGEGWYSFSGLKTVGWYPKANFDAWLTIESKKGVMGCNSITLIHDSSVLHIGYLPTFFDFQVSNDGTYWNSFYNDFKLTWTNVGSIYSVDIPSSLSGTKWKYFRMRARPVNHPFVWWNKIVLK